MGQPVAYPMPAGGVAPGPQVAASPGMPFYAQQMPGPQIAGGPQQGPWGNGFGQERGGPRFEPSLGLQVATAPAGGVTVLGVQTGSKAHRAGLRFGDVVVKVGQSEVRNVDQFQQLAGSAARSDSVPLLVARNGSFVEYWLPP